jgi:hypothetical protein
MSSSPSPAIGCSVTPSSHCQRSIASKLMLTGKLCFPRSSRPSSAALPRRKSALRHSVGGGGERNRTVDLLLAKQALSQLSYTPKAIAERSSVAASAVAKQPREPHRAD